MVRAQGTPSWSQYKDSAWSFAGVNNTKRQNETQSPTCMQDMIEIFSPSKHLTEDVKWFVGEVVRYVREDLSLVRVCCGMMSVEFGVWRMFC